MNVFEIRMYSIISVKDGMVREPILPVYEKSRIRSVTTPEEARYVLTNYRWRREGYPDLNEFFSIKVRGAEILTVYKIMNS